MTARATCQRSGLPKTGRFAGILPGCGRPTSAHQVRVEPAFVSKSRAAKEPFCSSKPWAGNSPGISGNEAAQTPPDPDAASSPILLAPDANRTGRRPP
ncbi:MAG: hypothetical protein D6766_08050 [Verrucomicrobia bacterium]|nr:MAG: hypothetical protein D6766_08050 [Verrucomicrobiota bacterium]